MTVPIYHKMLQKQRELERWAQKRFGDVKLPIYSSVDLRVTDYKVSVVDTNLFPSGFNNLCATFSSQAARVFQRTLTSYGTAPLKILIIPEAHTRNLYYWSNIEALLKILKEAGHEPIVGRSTELGVDLPAQIDISPDTSLPLSALTRYGNRIETERGPPDLILLNNDLSQGFPELLTGIRQPVIPSALLGWYHRSKSHHFRIYQSLIDEVAKILAVDPWLLSPLMATTRDVRMHEEESRKRLGHVVDELIVRIEKKYREHGINSEPYVFIKDDAGTYGMGITHVISGQQVLELNRRTRNKMVAGKKEGEVTDFLLQEGLPTNQTHEGRPIEPVFYLIGGEPVGHFFRIHDKKTERDNLNARGMSFDCLCSHKLEAEGKVTHIDCNTTETLRVVGGWLAKIATYAASIELKELEKSAEASGAYSA